MEGVMLLCSCFLWSCDPGYNFTLVFVVLFFEIYKGHSKPENVIEFYRINKKIDLFFFSLWNYKREMADFFSPVKIYPCGFFLAEEDIYLYFY